MIFDESKLAIHRPDNREEQTLALVLTGVLTSTISETVTINYLRKVDRLLYLATLDGAAEGSEFSVLAEVPTVDPMTRSVFIRQI